MAAKELLFEENARRALERGANAVANAVKVTLGPRGRNVVIDKKWGSPTITKDGVTVAKEIELEDHFENMGAQLVREVASKTNDVAGDGTTTATVLAHRSSTRACATSPRAARRSPSSTALTRPWRPRSKHSSRTRSRSRTRRSPRSPRSPATTTPRSAA
jgi:hypothetical protein